MADSPGFDTLSARQQKALFALLDTATIAKASERSGVPERTIYTWLREPAFDAAYRQARRDAVRAATAGLQRASAAAVAVIAHIMTSKDAPASTRLAAARTVLELAIQSVELDDVLARLEALEAR